MKRYRFKTYRPGAASARQRRAFAYCQEEGRQAFRDGKTLDDCPYRPTSRTERYGWIRGWGYERAASKAQGHGS